MTALDRDAIRARAEAAIEWLDRDGLRGSVLELARTDVPDLLAALDEADERAGKPWVTREQRNGLMEWVVDLVRRTGNCTLSDAETTVTALQRLGIEVREVAPAREAGEPTAERSYRRSIVTSHWRSQILPMRKRT